MERFVFFAFEFNSRLWHSFLLWLLYPWPWSSIGLIQSTPTPQSEQLQIINHKMIRDDYGVKVTGAAKNVTSRNLFAMVRVKYYDASGILVDTGIAGIDSLGAGETWNFETSGVSGEKASKVTRYEISGRDSFITD
jgi:hypothetical protein